MKKISILFVDDDPFILASTSHDLGKEGYRIITAESGEKAIPLITDERFDLVITDLIMEPIDGLTVLKRAKQISPETMVIILTGYSDVPSSVEAFRLGADDYLVKPCDIEELNYRVKRCLKHLEDKNRRRDAEKAAREREEQYKQLLDLMPDAVVVLGADFIPRIANRKFTELFGYAVDEALNLSPFALIHEKDKKRVEKRLEDRFKGRASAREYDIIDLVSKDGTPIDCEVSGALIQFDGRPADLVIMRDITERIRAEKDRTAHLTFLKGADSIDQAIRRATDLEQMLNNVLETTISTLDCDRCSLIFPCDPDAKSWSVLMECTRPQYPKLGDLSKDIPLSDGIRELFKAALESEEPLVFDPKTGREIQAPASQVSIRSSIVMPVYPRVGKPWIFGVSQCSYSRVWTEDEKQLFKEIGRRIADGLSSMLFLGDLKKSEEKYRDMVELTSDWIWEVDVNGVYTYSNPNAKKILGYDPEEIIGKACFDFLTASEEERIRKIFNINSEQKKPAILLDFAMLHKNGHLKTIQVNAVPVLSKEGVLLGHRGINRDITNRKKAEDSLRESEEKYRILMENVGAAVVYFDRGFRLVLANSRVCKDMKMDMEAIKGKSLYDFFEKAEAERFVEIFTDIARRGRGADFESLINITGKERWMHSYVEPVKNTQGEHIGFVDIIYDITEHKEAEKALKESEERYRQLANLLPQVVFETDAAGNMTFANSIAFEIFGFTKGAFDKGISAVKMIIPEDRDMARSNMQRILGGERLPGIEYTILTRDGSTYPAMIYTNPIIKDANPVGLRGIIADLSEAKRAQEALRESEERLARLSKMESLGLMAGGIAHDLNNILSGIVSYPELLLMDLPEDSPLVKPIRTIQESGLRAAEVVSDLLTIAKGVAVGKEVSNLNTIVNEYLASVEHRKIATVHPSIEFKARLDLEILNINCSPIHIKKGLMNLVNNASEAINGNGAVTISTMNRYLDEPRKGYEDMPTGEYAVLTVSDNGTGISQEDLGKIFEPFYTRKVMGRSGTGLGLTVVWNSVQNHGGFINVKSGNGGTVFELYFPATRAEVNAEERRVSQDSYIGHGEKILVVDDEDRQREIAFSLLSRLGYKVEAVPSGEQAVEYLSNHAVDLIVLDMIMPKGMNGRETYEQIIKVHSKQKAIITSGFSDTEDVNAIQKLGAGTYIKKPYTVEKIGIAVKEELARK